MFFSFYSLELKCIWMQLKMQLKKDPNISDSQKIASHLML